MFKKIFQRLKFRMLARQLRRPSGAAGNRVGEMMNQANAFLYDFTIDVMKPADNDTILEIGFGNGKLFEKIFNSAKDLRVYGLDFSETMFKSATQHNTERIKKAELALHHGNSDKLPFPDQQFDKIFCINVVYFWDDPVPHLQEIKRVLKPGGRFYATVRTKESMTRMPFTQYGFRFYDTDKWKQALEKAGLKLLEEQYIDDPVFDGSRIGIEEKITAQSLCVIAIASDI